MDLYASFTDDEIVVTNPVLERPVIVGIARPDVLGSLELSDRFDEFCKAAPAGRAAALRKVCEAVVPCIRFVREGAAEAACAESADDDASGTPVLLDAEGMEVTFGGRMWGEMTEPDRVEACIRVWAIIVKPIIVELTGRVAGGESLGKSQRRSAGAS